MSEVSRRAALGALAVGTGAVAVGTSAVACSQKRDETGSKTAEQGTAPSVLGSSFSPVVSVFPLSRGKPWPTPDPFLFCVHHNDRYPRGNGKFGPDASLAGRQMGQDFSWKDGWNMYHGQEVPGFPAHPHRGFETVTVVRRGRLDHADSLGAAARYGDGDVQWLTAGAGIQHAEMFPLLSEETENQLDLFQIWLNLPKKSKMVAPYFRMLWAQTIPTKVLLDAEGRSAQITVRAGAFGEVRAPAPPPDSWASELVNEVGIWTLALEPGVELSLPPASPGIARHLYFFSGTELEISGRRLRAMQGANLFADRTTVLKNGVREGEALVLQGRPIAEPIARRGPFVMNTEDEIREAYADYRRTRFGGWPWPDSAPVHGADPARFAQREGKTERPG